MRRTLSFQPVMRWLAAIVLVAVPALTIWNLVTIQTIGRPAISFGPPLIGVTRALQLDWSWKAVEEGRLQKAISERVIEAIPFRNFLIRLNNELRFRFFGQTFLKEVIVGSNGQLGQSLYLAEYCQRTAGLAKQRADAIVPDLLQIQDYYRAKGAVFIYLITPSKIAHLPEYFVSLWPCPSTEAARAGFIPEYVSRLRASGIMVLDAASLVHELRTTLKSDLFPQGALHWDSLGAGKTTLAIIDEVNRQAQRELLPKLSLAYTSSRVIEGSDRDLAEFLNVLSPPVAYSTHKIKLERGVPCAGTPASTLNAVIVGSSFSHLPAELLIGHDCLKNLKVLFYLKLETYGGEPYRVLKRTPADGDLDALREVQVMIVEENESFVGRSRYIEELRKIVERR